MPSEKIMIRVAYYVTQILCILDVSLVLAFLIIGTMDLVALFSLSALAMYLCSQLFGSWLTIEDASSFLAYSKKKLQEECEPHKE